MYLISIVVFIVIMVLSILLGATLPTFLDMPSLLIVLLVTIPMLMASGLMPDFRRAFKVIMTKANSFSNEELEKSLIAVQLTMKLIIGSGIFGSLIGFIAMLRSVTDMKILAPSISIILLTSFYALFFLLILLPIQAKLRSLLVSADKK